jgi:tryptophan synthase alpha chain
MLGKRKALVGFITAGDPTLPHTLPAMHALVEGGVDILELGIPFSDPEAEGPTIQASSERALANHVTLKSVLGMVREFRKVNAETPVVLMGYLNSVLAMADFPAAAQDAGVDGLIMVNLPPEEEHELQARLRDCEIDLIFLVAPTTTRERAQKIVQRSAGFIYYVSLKGITGANHLVATDVGQNVAELQSLTDLPICVGFGIKDGATAAQIAPLADGVVVGSALVQLMAEHATDVDAAAGALREAAAKLRASIDGVDYA